MRELVGGAGGLGWVAVKGVLIFAVAVIGLRHGERCTLAQLGAFDFAVAVATGAIIGGSAISSSVSFIGGAVALVTLLVAHRLVAGRLDRRGPVFAVARAGRVAASAGRRVRPTLW